MKNKVMIMSWCLDFECPGGDCGLTCCTADWKIVLDDKALKKYRDCEHEFADELRDAVDFDNKKMKCDNGLCNLLDENGFCKIVQKLGPEYLSTTCSAFPRGVKTICDTEEICVEIVCPVVAKRLLDTDPIEIYIQEKDTESSFDENYYDSYKGLCSARENLIELLKYKENEYSHGKMYILLKIYDEIVKLIKDNALSESKVDELFLPYMGQENIDRIYETCEAFKEQKELRTLAIEKIIHVANRTSLLGLIMQNLIRRESCIRDCVTEWLNDSNLLREDTDKYSEFIAKEYPMLFDRYYIYSLYTSWTQTNIDNFEKSFLCRVVEYMLIHICGMSIYKKNAMLSRDDLAVVIASIDRVLAHNDKTPEKIYNVYNEIRDESFTYLLSMLI